MGGGSHEGQNNSYRGELGKCGIMESNKKEQQY